MSKRMDLYDILPHLERVNHRLSIGFRTYLDLGPLEHVLEHKCYLDFWNYQDEENAKSAGIQGKLEEVPPIMLSEEQRLQYPTLLDSSAIGNNGMTSRYPVRAQERSTFELDVPEQHHIHGHRGQDHKFRHALITSTPSTESIVSKHSCKAFLGAEELSFRNSLSSHGTSQISDASENLSEGLTGWDAAGVFRAHETSIGCFDKSNLVHLSKCHQPGHGYVGGADVLASTSRAPGQLSEASTSAPQVQDSSSLTKKISRQHRRWEGLGSGSSARTGKHAIHPHFGGGPCSTKLTYRSISPDKQKGSKSVQKFMYNNATMPVQSRCSNSGHHIGSSHPSIATPPQQSHSKRNRRWVIRKL